MRQRKLQARTLEREKAMIAAATELFLEKGFEQTTLTDIVDRSKGSRGTLYELFGCKKGLLSAIIEEATGRVMENAHLMDPLPDVSEEGLIEFGCGFVKAISTPEAIRTYQLVVSQGGRIPEVAALFLDRGPNIFRAKLAELFQRAFDSGEFKVGTPEKLARIYIGSLLADFDVHRTTGMPPDWSEDDIDDHVRLAVKIFLAGVRAQSNP